MAEIRGDTALEEARLLDEEAAIERKNDAMKSNQNTAMADDGMAKSRKWTVNQIAELRKEAVEHEAKF